VSYKKDPAQRERRAAIRAYWNQNPTARIKEVAAHFGVSKHTASGLKPTAVRKATGALHDRNTGQREQRNALALQLYFADAPLSDIAAATGRSIKTTRVFLRAHTVVDFDPARFGDATP
jgi:hypothetical protein